MEIEGVPMKEGGCSENCASDFWMGFFRFALLLITLPLHFIPILGSIAPHPTPLVLSLHILVQSTVGTLAFCYLNGLLATWSLKMPYFHAFNISWQQQWNEFVSPNKSDYYSFGFSAMLLNCIPVVNFLFVFTNNIGAAIWCANEQKARAAATAQQGDQQPASDVKATQYDDKVEEK